MKRFIFQVGKSDITRINLSALFVIIFNTRMLKGAILTPFDVHFAVILLLSSVSVVPFKNLLILLF